MLRTCIPDEAGFVRVQAQDGGVQLNRGTDAPVSPFTQATVRSSIVKP